MDARQSIEAAKADVARREAAVADMQQKVAAAEERIAGLRARMAEVADDEDALDGMAAELGPLQAKLQAQRAALGERRAAVEAATRAVERAERGYLESRREALLASFREQTGAVRALAAQFVQEQGIPALERAFGTYDALTALELQLGMQPTPNQLGGFGGTFLAALIGEELGRWEHRANWNRSFQGDPGQKRTKAQREALIHGAA